MTVLVNRAYEADRIRTPIEEQGATLKIPSKSNRSWKPRFSNRLYRERTLINRLFSKLENFREKAPPTRSRSLRAGDEIVSNLEGLCDLTVKLV